MRLSTATLGSIPLGIARPEYVREEQAAGIVHFGIGAFHRAHQAFYTDAAMNSGDRDWGIVGVSLRSASVAEQLNPQDGLYTLIERSAECSGMRVIGAVQRVLVAHRQASDVVEAIASPATNVISLTITEKGYCRTPGGTLDARLADAASVYAYLRDGLARRRDRTLPGVTLLSCDNLADNGSQLARLLGEYLDGQDPALRRWFEAECTCPSTMVDRIVPATTGDDRAAVHAATGLDDHGAVVTERFSQWVIEDKFAGPRPRWEDHGVQLVSDVRPYETAKLRLLNAAHSLLAYAGLQRGHEYVHQAVADPELTVLVERLMRVEAAPTIAAEPDQDLSAYADALMARFANPALNHRLSQIAMDGSQKIPQRWLETLAWNRARGRETPALEAGFDAWFAHLHGVNGPVDDPRADELATLPTNAARTDLLDMIFGTDWRSG